MSSIAQIVRIVLHLLAGALLGDAVANSAEFQGAVGGLLAIGNFGWWLYANRKTQV